MVPKLSAIIPSIRKENLVRLYESLEKSFSHGFEFIVVGPYGLPEELKNKENCVFIQDWGSPVRAQQIGLCASRFEYVTFLADDGWCLPGAFDIAYNTLVNESYRTIITGKYQEGDRVNDNMEKDDYYTLSTHESMQLPGVPKDCKMFNCGLIHRSLLMELGGWDCIFQCCPYAYNDFAIRAYRYGAKFILQQEPLFACTHLPGTTGDHFAIHNAQLNHDAPLFNGIYCIASTYLMRQNISVNNWQKSPSRWMERFGE